MPGCTRRTGHVEKNIFLGSWPWGLSEVRRLVLTLVDAALLAVLAVPIAEDVDGRVATVIRVALHLQHDLLLRHGRRVVPPIRVGVGRGRRRVLRGGRRGLVRVAPGRFRPVVPGSRRLRPVVPGHGGPGPVPGAAAVLGVVPRLVGRVAVGVRVVVGPGGSAGGARGPGASQLRLHPLQRQKITSVQTNSL